MIVDLKLLKKIEDNPYAYKDNSPRQTRELLEKWQRELINDIDAVDRFDGLDWYKRDKANVLTRVNILIDIIE